MGRKSKSTANNLGRALIRDRFGGAGKVRRSRDGDSLLHTSEIADGYDWGRLNLQSVTEESSFKEFLSTAELAETEFQAEKLNITFVNPKSSIGLLSREEREKVKQSQDRNAQLLGIPRRPRWDAGTTAEELQAAEREEFLQWRRRLALLQEGEGLLLTPYEKNLEFWRQLWRVVERSDVVAQIVDARNPLMFRCPDLEQYVKEVSPDKMNMILVNKADFLTVQQREAWARYFAGEGVPVAFFSALLAGEEPGIDDEVSAGSGDRDDGSSDGDGREVEPEGAIAAGCDTVPATGDSTAPEAAGDEHEQCREPTVGSTDPGEPTAAADEASAAEDTDEKLTAEIRDQAKLLTRSELIALFRTLHSGPKVMPGVTTVGLVGYPNVGKSSTINSLMMHKKVSVSATPGKTKHFQTLYLEKDVLLCDCPGLVMPSFVLTKADMVVSGILPVDQMRDHVPPVTLVASLVPRHVLEARYGLMLPAPPEGEDPARPPTAEELLNAHAFNRGFMTQNGLPDNPRSARYVLKDFVSGKLLYCHAPPGCNQASYHAFPDAVPSGGARQISSTAARMTKPVKVSSADLDKVFFRKTVPGVHQRGVPPQPGTAQPPDQDDDGGASASGSSANPQQRPKPWRNHQYKRNKREKLRKVYSHLDQ
ncbi:large subunit GTPase 1 homolog [Bacillus rossius redtenbacheri]|uniref:large subunit GTPase 1 homolog n=1 Tax=Bacillus rossius redtenbacheri TaxID=93214 RepID=UPI002FDD602D